MEIPVEILMINERMFKGFITFKYLLLSSGTAVTPVIYKTTTGVHIYTISSLVLNTILYRSRHRIKNECEDSYLVSLYLCGISFLLWACFDRGCGVFQWLLILF